MKDLCADVTDRRSFLAALDAYRFGGRWTVGPFNGVRRYSNVRRVQFLEGAVLHKKYVLI